MPDPNTSLTDREKSYIVRVIARTHVAISDVYLKRIVRDPTTIPTGNLRVPLLSESVSRPPDRVEGRPGEQANW